MQKLIDFGADIHIHSLYGGPIHAAVALDDEIALEALMRKSVNVDDIIDGGITPLACAAYNGSVTSMKTLLQAGANVQISKPIGKAIVADLTSSESMVQILLDSGANADAIDEVMFEDPPIIAAAKRKQMNVVQLLLSSSTPIEGVDWSLNGIIAYTESVTFKAEDDVHTAARVTALRERMFNALENINYLLADICCKALRNDVSTTEWDRLRNLNLLYLSHSFHGQKPVLSSDAIVNMALVYQKQDKGKEVMCLKAALALNPQNERAESLLSGSGFSWSSGAIYEGDLAGGYMHGQGTYIGELGDTFAGLWANNLRHGRGTQAYVNGDVYDGHWRDGLQDGHGQYIWRGGHEYIGTWKAGEMHGRGTVIWADDDRYDGAWEDAKPKGQGTFRWSDGGMYIGLWCQESGETQGKGVYYPPSGGPAVPLPREPKEVITKLLEELEMSEGKTVSLLPSQKVLTWPGVEPVTKKPVWRPPEVAADQGMWRPPEVGPDQGRRSSRRNNMSSDIDSLVEGEDGGEESRNDRSWVRTPSCMRAPTLPKPGKKQGETISKGHKNYELMLNLQLGIILDVPIIATHFSAERTMSLRGGGESAGSDSPCRREEAKSRTPRPQPGSAGERSAAASAEMSSREGANLAEAIHCSQAKPASMVWRPPPPPWRQAPRSPRGQAATPYSAAPFDESMLVQHSTGKAMGNREADVAAVGLGPKNSGLKICPARSLVSNLFLFL
uniref:Uncharacterized protein n=1 Tax=Oryza barthii TaxID=65489 RepID=A0A0D3HI54_9ORYZ